jgi:hypothetical protein
MAVVHSEINSDQILKMALGFAKKINDDTLRPDQIATVARRVRDARKKLKDEDAPWSLGGNPELLDKLVPIEARRDVLDASIWHLIGGTKFTFRQAKWIGRLRGSFRKRQQLQYYTFELASYAMWYAHEELASMAIGTQFDSSYWDLSLANYQDTRPHVGAISASANRQLVALQERNLNRSRDVQIRRLIRPDTSNNVFDVLAQTIAMISPKADIELPKLWQVADRGSFGLVVLRFRREGAEEFLNSSPEHQSALVDRLYQLTSERPLSLEEWPEDWDKWDE